MGNLVRSKRSGLWEQVDLEANTIELAPEETKTDESRLIVLTSRAKEALRTLASRFKKKGFVWIASDGPSDTPSPDLERHLMDGVVPVTEPVPRCVIGLRLPGPIRGPHAQGGNTARVEAGHQLPPLPASALGLAD